MERKSPRKKSGRSRSPSPVRTTSLSTLFLDPSNRDILTYLLPFLGKSGRRGMGKTSKKIYENLGGKEQAKKDYSELYENKNLKKLLNQTIINFRDRIGMSFSTFKDTLKLYIMELRNDFKVGKNEYNYLSRLLEDIDYYQSYIQKKLVL